MRPLQFLYLAGLYELFGMSPVGYHLVNAIVLAAGAVLFHLALRGMGEPRALALVVPLVYALLPHYSTDRLWVAAFQAGLSMTLYFLCLYADLRAWRTRGRAYWAWKSTVVLALLGSALAYELFIPALLLNPFIVWCLARRQANQTSERLPDVKALAWFTFPNLLALGAVAVFKVVTTSRANFGEDDFVFHLRWFYRLIRSSTRVSYIEYGVELPLRVWQIAQTYFDGWTFVVDVVLSVLVFLYVNRSLKDSGGVLSTSRMGAYGVVGLFAFLLGYFIFLTNYNALATATGIANRVAIAAAVGVAISFVGAAGLVSSVCRSAPLRRVFFSAMIAFLAGSGFLINNTIASFWIEAYQKEQEVLAAIDQHWR